MSGDPQLGATLKDQRKAAGVKLETLARRLRISKGHLSNMENGRRSIPAEVIIAYRNETGRDDDMKRRELLTGAAVGVIAPVVASDLVRHGFLAKMQNEAPTVDEWHSRLSNYGRDYMTKGAGPLQRTMAGDMVVLQQGANSADRWAVAAPMLAVFGKVSANPSEAIDWYKLASTAADHSEDSTVNVWVLGRAAIALGYEGAAPRTALSFANQAIELSHDRPSLGLLNALAGKAHVLALRGLVTDARRTWEEAHRIFDRAGSSEKEMSDFAVPWWRFSVYSSMMHARLGSHDAEHWQDETLRAVPTTLPRFRTHVELHRGLTMVHGGDPNGGVAYAKKALQALPSDKRSQSLVLMLREVQGAARRRESAQQ